MKNLIILALILVSYSGFAMVESSKDCKSNMHYQLSKWGKGLAKLERKSVSLQKLYREGQESFVREELFKAKVLAVQIESSVNSAKRFCVSLELKKPIVLEKLQVHVDKIVAINEKYNEKICMPEEAMEIELLSNADKELNNGRKEKAFFMLSKARKLASYRLDNKTCFGDKSDEVEKVLIEINKRLDQLVAGL